MPNHRRAPAGYKVRIAGHLDQYWSAWFDGLGISHENDGTTTLRGGRLDQAELHGILGKVRELGLALISVQPIDSDCIGDPQPGHSAGGDPSRGVR